MILSNFIIFIVLIIPITSVVIRVRLSSGLMHRVTVDDDNSDSNTKKVSLRVLRKALNDKNLITDSSVISISGNKYDNDNNEIEWISANEGEIIDIIDNNVNASDSINSNDDNTSKESKKFVRKVSSFSQTSSSSSTTTTSPSSKKVASIADIEKFRGSLEKIAAQKNGGNSSVAITPMAGKVLKRLANGGCGLLLGKVLKKEDSILDRKTSKVGRLKGIGEGAGSKKAKKDDDPKECIEVPLTLFLTTMVIITT